MRRFAGVALAIASAFTLFLAPTASASGDTMSGPMTGSYGGPCCGSPGPGFDARFTGTVDGQPIVAFYGCIADDFQPGILDCSGRSLEGPALPAQFSAPFTYSDHYVPNNPVLVDSGNAFTLSSTWYDGRPFTCAGTETPNGDPLSYDLTGACTVG